MQAPNEMFREQLTFEDQRQKKKKIRDYLCYIRVKTSFSPPLFIMIICQNIIFVRSGLHTSTLFGPIKCHRGHLLYFMEKSLALLEGCPGITFGGYLSFD